MSLSDELRDAIRGSPTERPWLRRLLIAGLDELVLLRQLPQYTQADLDRLPAAQVALWIAMLGALAEAEGDEIQRQHRARQAGSAGRGNVLSIPADR